VPNDKNCGYYPCHKLEDMDCTYCYCPVYPCKNEGYGGRWVKTKDPTSIYPKGFALMVWDCSDCIFLHEVSKR
jgi:Zn-finger protein